jgi:hypothetical protein
MNRSKLQSIVISSMGAVAGYCCAVRLSGWLTHDQLPRRHRGRAFLVAGGDQEELRPWVETRGQNDEEACAPNRPQKSRPFGTARSVGAREDYTSSARAMYLPRDRRCSSLTAAGCGSTAVVQPKSLLVAGSRAQVGRKPSGGTRWRRLPERIMRTTSRSVATRSYFSLSRSSQFKRVGSRGCHSSQ